MSEQKIKGSFMGGYSKKDVNKFIADMSADFKHQSDEKDASIAFERSRADKAEENLRLTNEKLDEIAIAAFGAEQKQKELEKRIAALEKDRALLSDKLDEMAVAAKEAIMNLEATRKQFEDECQKSVLAEQKLDALACETYGMMQQNQLTEEMYAKIDQRIEDIFREADSKATEIIRQAQTISDEMVNETRQKTQNFKANLEDSYKNAVSEYKENVNAAVDNLLRAVSEGSNELNQRIDSVESYENTVKTSGVVPMHFSEEKKPREVVSNKDYISSINDKIEKFFKGAINALNSLIGRK
ncbi:MAG: hypothetical protein K6F14_01275 [Clostridiales bacterium]|nr:hypothetical protein [Clostridiales bacterium]